MSAVLVTGSSGLVGSACVRHFSALGWVVHGIDSNARRDFFGQAGDTTRTRDQLEEEVAGFAFHEADLRNDWKVSALVGRLQPSLIVHAAAQPSHDWAALHPYEDFSVNTVATLKLLEAVRQRSPESVFVFLSTNKVYGDEPNEEFDFEELPTRFEPFDWDSGEVFANWQGFNETCPIDQSVHSLFGASKLAADIYVQEYGRYFGLKTCCFRCGCLTGSAHAGVEQHGFLAYLARCVREGLPYKVFGFKGKQVRDQLHAYDVARACEEFAKAPRAGEVYNLGGGRANSISVLEAIDALEQATGKRLAWEYVDEPRKGDHICYISDSSKFRSHFPAWQVTRSLPDIIADLTFTPAIL